MKCPICGKDNTLYIAELSQNSKDYRIKKNGERSKNPSNIQRNLPLDEIILCCDNGCNVNDLYWAFVDGKLKLYFNNSWH